ncbi:SH3 domain-containing protein [Paraburkholderia sp. SIMBA_030]|uniref:SH3 domain-containing protein n=1 Tax=Paraburkholderia sp. SIMBA_030 TaxID=3085773 RepID=UPI003978C744
MQKHFVIRSIPGICLIAFSGTAFAQVQAYTNAPVDIYAGPAPDYPVVAEVPEGVPLTVMGCVEGYSWCDVAAPDLRGWVYGGSLSYPYQGANVPVMTYGVQIGLPVVVFSIDSYWGHYYRGRPWYHDAPRWANHPPPARGGPPPARGDVGRPPGPPPGREPAYGHAPETPPERGGTPHPGSTHSTEQPPPRGGPPQQVQPQARPQPQPGPQPGQGPAHAMDAPQMHGGSPPPTQRGGEARGGAERGGNERENRPDNH